MDKKFELPEYNPPNFNLTLFQNSPVIKTAVVKKDGVAPENYHATTIYPEYFHVEKGKWIVPKFSRMDCVIVVNGNNLEVKEFRHLKKGDKVVVGRGENGEEGIYVHTDGFSTRANKISREKFSFHITRTRETPFSRDYDSLYELLRYEREHGKITWVLGPAVTFDHDSRVAMSELILSGYVSYILAGNALATHDIEASIFKTGLGQDIYSKEYKKFGHYNHLDAINIVRKEGSIYKLFKKGILKDGIIYSCFKKKVPFILAGSIRDDGPLPEVISNVYEAQDAMRKTLKETTTVIALATQLHAIAVGNMFPSYTIYKGKFRPLFFYIVDISEFALNKLANRGSLEVHGIVTNVQDFLINVNRALKSK